MPVVIDGQTFYRTNEVCHMVGISRSTLFRWLKENPAIQPTSRDWRGWRLFSSSQIEQLKVRTGAAFSVKNDSQTG
jgi:predicted DNA-binding transcriptional regulator AlpA